MFSSLPLLTFICVSAVNMACAFLSWRNNWVCPSTEVPAVTKPSSPACTDSLRILVFLRVCPSMIHTEIFVHISNALAKF